MRFLLFTSLLWSCLVIADEPPSLSQEELKEMVREINKVQNQVMYKGSTVADVDRLFSMYTEDFVYQHDKYGGVYTRENLYNNTARYVKSGGYQRTDDRYVILEMIAGLNAVAVLRREIYKGEAQDHLSIFEFEGSKVSKIKEYW